MKKLIFCVLLCFPFPFLQAQPRDLEIDYIAHDRYNGAILNAVKGIFQTHSVNKNKQTYLYLANADHPLILKCDENAQDEFDEFCYALNGQARHNIWPEADVLRILELLREDDFIDDEGNPRYDFFTLNFYITPSFWTYNYKETLIARLFWDLELSDKKNFHVNVFHPENDGFDYDETPLFGPKNLNGDYKVYLFTYSE